MMVRLHALYLGGIYLGYVLFRNIYKYVYQRASYVITDSA